MHTLGGHFFCTCPWADNNRICIEEVPKLVYAFWICKPKVIVDLQILIIFNLAYKRRQSSTSKLQQFPCHYTDYTLSVFLSSVLISFFVFMFIPSMSSVPFNFPLKSANIKGCKMAKYIAIFYLDYMRLNWLHLVFNVNSILSLLVTSFLSSNLIPYIWYMQHLKSGVKGGGTTWIFDIKLHIDGCLHKWQW